jgi:hypothetical protein
MSHCVVDYPYPTVDKGVEVLRHLVSDWSTLLSDKACLAHCVFVVEGVALSYGLPLHEGFGDMPIETADEAKAVVEAAASELQGVGAAEGDAAGVDAVGKVDWMKVLKALKFLLNLVAA